MFEKISEGFLVGTGGNVPCNGCKACCKKEVVVLFPERGDDVTEYDCVEVDIEGTGKRLALAHKPNGDCVYLGDDGCTIYGRAPAVCKEFDCRTYFLVMDRNERRRHLKAGTEINNRKEIFAAARERLHTLTRTQRDLAMYMRANSELPKPEVSIEEERRFAGEFAAAKKAPIR